MSMDDRFWRAVMAVAIFLGGAWILISRVPESEGADGSSLAVAPRAGFLAPDFSLTTLDGSTVRLSDLRGEPVLINFWATWCGPCRNEMPHIQASFEAHADDGLVVLAVNQQESPGSIANFVEALGLTFPVPLDGDGDVSAHYQARALPTSFFVDAEGVIRGSFTGPMTPGLIESKLDLILPDGGS